jgi:hypothetical protein
VRRERQERGRGRSVLRTAGRLTQNEQEEEEKLKSLAVLLSRIGRVVAEFHSGK